MLIRSFPSERQLRKETNYEFTERGQKGKKKQMHTIFFNSSSLTLSTAICMAHTGRYVLDIYLFKHGQKCFDADYLDLNI